jgi:hypothetical protein
MAGQRTVLAPWKGLCYYPLLAVAFLQLASNAWAQDSPAKPVNAQDSAGETIVYGPPNQFPWQAFSTPFSPCSSSLDEGRGPSGAAVRFGWWGVEHNGSPWVVGQWQGTQSSPFWDIDGLWTNGTRSLNYSATGTDNDSTRAKIQYFGPNSQGFFDFTRFPHAQEHQNLDNMNASAIIPGTGPGSGQPVIPQDLNKGQDYAIRVNQYEAQYKFNVLGKPGKDAPWFTAGINVWDQQEVGDRQANDAVHCFTARVGQQASCHVLSQMQSINWNTFEITPTFEGKFANVNIQYSHTLRVFSTSDGTALGTYTDGGANILSGTYPYDVVPQSLFNMDKIKLGIDLNEYNRLYGYGYFSEVENSEAGVSREIGGVDLRWTNTTFKGLSLTTYFTNYDQSGNRPTALLSPDMVAGLTPAQQAAELAQLRNQPGYNRYTEGEKFSWRPWAGASDSVLGRLAITGGYEFDYLIRSYQTWFAPSLSAKPPLFAPSATTPVLFQPNTATHALNIGVQTPWSDSIHTYARYKVKFVKDALVGFDQSNGAVNSSLPDTENIIEFGADWFPSQCFGASFAQSFDLASRVGGPLVSAGSPVTVATAPGDIINFGEDSYSTTLVFWYRPVDDLTLSFNSDYFANQIKQNITVGDDEFGSTTGSGPSFVSYSPYTSPWTYGGTAVEFGGGLMYQFTRRLRFTADYEITFGKDLITSGGLVYSAGTPVINTFIPLGSYSAVRNVMQQARVGFDYKLRAGMDMYVRYQLVDFEDRADSANSGTLNMVLGGMALRW